MEKDGQKSSETLIDYDQVSIFWFGDESNTEYCTRNARSTSYNHNYHTKWFPDGNSGVQAATDKEIFSRFSTLLNKALNGELDHWKDQLKSCLSLVIVLDQFSRHIFRHTLIPSDDPIRKQADSLALSISIFIHEKYNHEVCDLPMAEFIFSLMPYRHNATVSHLEFVLKQLEFKEQENAKSQELLERFRKQTIRRLLHLQDRARLEQTDEILDFLAFQADESDILSHSLTKATESFFKKYMSNMPYSSTAATSSAPDSLIALISLSGGVDSMVLSKILAVLRDSKRLPISSIVAIHIDYANRPESGREASYVQEWCAGLGIYLHIRVVNEVTRGITERDQYEKVARDIRYGTYKEVIAMSLHGKFHAMGSLNDSVHISGVIFGHHLGDVQENIISNVMRGSSPLYLSGMTETSLTNGVIVWRPLLQHRKEEIYAFSHKYGVPYFKDSTPSWSTRGKLRNKLVPLLKEIYGEGCLSNLSNLAWESDQTRELVQQNLYGPFMDSVRRFPCGLEVNIEGFRKQPQCFWREVLKQLMHSMGMSMIRDKAVGNFLERIQRNFRSVPHGWLELRKGFHTYLSDQSYLQVLQDGVLFADLVVYNPTTTKNQLRQAKDKVPKGAVSAAMKLTLEGDQLSQPSFTVQVIASSLLSTVMVDYDQVGFRSLVERGYPGCYHSDSACSSGAGAAAASALPSSAAVASIEYGPWYISIRTTEISDEARHSKKKLLQSMSDLFPGRFEYDVLVPVVPTGDAGEHFQFTLMLLKELLAMSEIDPTGANSEDSALSSSLNSALVDFKCMEPRVRDGLPFLAPWISSSPSSGGKFATMTLSYQYKGRRADIPEHPEHGH